MKWLFGEKCFNCGKRFWRNMSSLFYTARNDYGLPEEHRARVCHDCCEVFRDIVDQSSAIAKRANEIMTNDI